MERRLLQGAVAVAALVPIFAGGAGAIWGTDILHRGLPGQDLDSHFRYLSGLLLGIGLTAWACIPHIERRTTVVRVFTGIVVLGGLARLAGGLLDGRPGMPMAPALVMELLVTPALCLWQGRVSRRYASR